MLVLVVDRLQLLIQHPELLDAVLGISLSSHLALVVHFGEFGLSLGRKLRRGQLLLKGLLLFPQVLDLLLKLSFNGGLGTDWTTGSRSLSQLCGEFCPQSLLLLLKLGARPLASARQSREFGRQVGTFHPQGLVLLTLLGQGLETAGQSLILALQCFLAVEERDSLGEHDGVALTQVLILRAQVLDFLAQVHIFLASGLKPGVCVLHELVAVGNGRVVGGN
ncbi:hypothetical protein N7452_010170 [Penicillium brevicompactum]|uniref:Uncharacterized protein n=1 Tax=Penicillium brevicompactum TaxID=5074 RepID=A0A9W9UD23_PENBR|nr:hypothetical protein N7452_010170 [Penicillium brevicompactum]